MELPTNYSLINHIFDHLTVCKQITDDILLVLHSNTWNHLTVCKQMSVDSFKNCYLLTIRLQIIYLIYNIMYVCVYVCMYVCMYEED